MNFSVVLLKSVATVEHLAANFTRDLTQKMFAFYVFSQVIRIFHFVLALGTLPHLKAKLVCGGNHFLQDLRLDGWIVEQGIS
jgi:hypothetical protein